MTERYEYSETSLDVVAPMKPRSPAPESVVATLLFALLLGTLALELAQVYYRARSFIQRWKHCGKEDDWQSGWTDMNKMLSELLSEIHAGPAVLGETRRNDWRPFWDLARETQALFKEGLSEVSRHDREELWKRFNELRDEAQEVQTKEREAFKSQSEWHRDAILSDCSTLDFTATEQWVSHLVDSSDRFSAEQVKEKQRALAEVGKRLSENKHLMLKEHKQECFDRFLRYGKRTSDFGRTTTSERRGVSRR